MQPNVSKNQFKSFFVFACKADNECTAFIAEHLDALYNGYSGAITLNQACQEIKFCSNSLSNENDDDYEEIVDDLFGFETK